MESVAQIRRTLEAAGITLKKRWGQNFLVDPGAAQRLVGLLDARDTDRVWEIGGGGGALSMSLARASRHLTVFEIDHGLVRLLVRRLEGLPAVVVDGDFCRTWAPERDRHGGPDLVLGNLPYQSASRILAVLATSSLGARRIVVTVQRELGQRMSAAPSTKAYSSFSVLCQAAFRVRTAWDIAPRSFYPVPNVASRVMVLEPGVGPAPDMDALQSVTRALFATRRKTMGRTLKGMGPLGEAVREALEARGIGLGLRPEVLNVGAWVDLSREVTRILAARAKAP